jgi:hypothetical protein
MFSPRRLFSSRNYFSNWGGKIWIFRDTSQCVCFFLLKMISSYNSILT